jgi:hypothetical protein
VAPGSLSRDSQWHPWFHGLAEAPVGGPPNSPIRDASQEHHRQQDALPACLSLRRRVQRCTLAAQHRDALQARSFSPSFGAACMQLAGPRRAGVHSWRAFGYSSRLCLHLADDASAVPPQRGAQCPLSPSRPAPSLPGKCASYFSPSLAQLCSSAISTGARLRLQRAAHLASPVQPVPTTTFTCLPSLPGTSTRSQPLTPTSTSFAARIPRASDLATLAKRNRTGLGDYLLIASLRYVLFRSVYCLLECRPLGNGDASCAETLLWPPRGCSHVSIRPHIDCGRLLAFRGRLDISCAFAPRRQSAGSHVRRPRRPSLPGGGRLHLPC